MTDHELDLKEYPYVGDLDNVYFAVCSCGKYNSGKCGSEKQATKQWTDHKNSKEQLDRKD